MDSSSTAQKKYQKMVDKASPNSKILKNCSIAFISGGIICIIGQFINNIFTNMGFSSDDTGLLTLSVLVLASAILTGTGIYSRLGKICGAGTIVPVTGFANSVVSPAIEFKKEGLIFGTAAKMFILAGPVIVYGTLTSFIVGIIYFILR